MRKFIAILCTITLLAGTVSVSGATASDGDKDGDVVTNPWADLFTTAAAEVTTQEVVTDATTTAAVETTTQAAIDGDYSSLTYTTVSCDGGADLEYCVVSQDIEGWGTPWYGDAGNTFQMVYAGGDINPAESTTVKVNGVETEQGTGAVLVVGAGLIKVNPTQMSDNAYTAVEITTATGSALVVFKKGTPGTTVETTAVAETTTVAVETTTEEDTTVAVETTTEEDTTAAVETTTQGTSGDYSSLTYTTVSCDGGADLEYCVVSQDIEGWGTPWYGDAGNTFQMVYAGGNINPAESTTVKVNGVETEQGTGAVSVVGAGLIKVNPTQMSDNAYTAVEITTATGSALVVFKKGTPGTTVETTAVVETTTEEDTTVAVETTTEEDTTVATETTTEEDTTVAEETTTEKATSAYDPGFNPSLLTYTTLVCNGNEDLTLDYAIESTSVAGLAPWYGDGGNTLSLQFSAEAGVVAGITINGETPADGVVTETATGLVKINPTSFADDAYTVIDVTTENGEFTVVIKKGTPAEIPTTETTTVEVETTTVAEETTTVAEETTTKAEETTTVAVETTTEEDTTAAVETTTVAEETTTQGTSGDYSSLTYTTASCDGGADLEYCVVSQDIEGWGTPWYGDAGNTFQMVYAGGNINPVESTTVKVNGVETEQGTGAVSVVGAGLIKVNPTQMSDNAYTAVEITTATGSALVVFKKGTPGTTVETTAVVETTTEENTTVAVETTTEEDTTAAVETTTEEDTTVAEETTTEKATSAYDPGFNPSLLTYTTLVCNGNEELTLDYAIESTSVAGLAPWYGDGGNTLSLQFSADAGVVSGITINGETPADGVVTETATGLVKINPTSFADDAYTVIDVTTENGEFTVVIKKGTPAEIPTTETTTVEVETTTEEDTTVAVETTTEEDTTASVETTTVAEETTTVAEETTTVAEETTTKQTVPGYNPGFDPSSLTYTTIECDGQSDLALDYSIYESSVAGLVPWYGDGGNTFMIQYSGDAGVASEIKVNGEIPADGVVTETATGLVKINPTSFADDAYTVIDVTTDDGEFTVVVKKGTPAVTPVITTTAVVETTTEKVDTTTVEGETTTVAEETTTKQTTPGYNPGFDPSSLTYTTLECDGQSDLALDYSIYESTVAGLVPWYGDGGNTFMLQFSGDAGVVSGVAINGETPADGVITETATGLVKINPTSFADDAYTVIDVTTENGEFTVVVKKGTPAVTPVITTTAVVETTTEKVDTTTVAGETTTVAGETTTVAEETTTKQATPGYNPGFDPSSLTYTTLECDGQSDLALDYSIYESTIAGLVPWYGDGGNTFMLQFSGDAGVVSGVAINGETPADGVITETATGLVKINPTSFADDAYTVIDVTTENGEFTVVVKKGTPAVTPVITTTAVDETTTVAGETTTAAGETTTVAEETTTDAPTTNIVDPTTAKPVETTTVAPATQKPTGSQVTTAAPTTTQKATVVKVKKSKVKNATKKKSAKKIKLSLKKVKGAKYQIQISKAKKFKKKNILVKKNVKKAKLTIKSKKIRNKKKLFVRVRAFKLVNGKKYYSKWSKAKKVKIKK